MVIPAWNLAAWAVLVLAVSALAWATWRQTFSPTVRAGLVVLAAAALASTQAGSLLAPLLILFSAALTAITWWLARRSQMQRRIGLVWIGGLALLLVIAKLPAVQPTLGAGTWIGVSYFLFRLIHISLDARRDRVKDETLPETLTYALHPTTLIAGPIDRLQHSAAEQRRPDRAFGPEVNDGLWRVFIGLFKKAVLANLCYVILSAYDLRRQPDQPMGIAWLWLLAYTFYLYFDFSAYSDLAIGAARMMGLHVPENFANPYLQPTIGKFWQAWHITLSNWLRDYIFFPLSRSLLNRYGSGASVPILAVSHLTTMIVCGLWHGLGSGFVAWGVWHGVGLFVLSQVPTLRRRFTLPVMPTPLSTALTFAFVMIGWVFFSADLPTALRILGRLLGMA